MIADDLPFKIMVADWISEDTIWFVPTPPDDIKIRGSEETKKWLEENSVVIKNVVMD